MEDKKSLKSNSIPTWQLAEPPPGSKEPSQDSPGNSSGNSAQTLSPSRDSLIRQAATFLQDENIFNASLDRKRSFLQSKGLNFDEIDRLLQAPVSGSNATAETKNQIPESILIASSRKESVKDSEPPSSVESSAASREMPPIITYPEFLLHIQRPPPLVTVQNILASVYAACGVGLAVYGTSKFLISPMVDALSSARLSFLETCSSNLQLMNEKLEQTVSKIPSELNREGGSLVDRRLSGDLDPAELFYRSIATQTTPEASRLPSSDETFHPVGDSSPQTNSNEYMHRLRERLQELLASETAPADSSIAAKNQMKQFQHYLDSLAYGSLLMSNDPLSMSKEDEISKIKGEIRGFKGALLSARSFPSGAGVRARGSG